MKFQFARVTAALAATTASMVITAGPSEGATAPTLALTRACPGAQATVTGSGFADGSYLLHSMTGRFSTNVVTASGGTLSPSPVLSLPANAPHSFAIWATPQAGGSSVTQLDASLASPTVSAQNAYSDPTVLQLGNCFAPGEAVSVSPSATLSAPKTVTADAHGNVAVRFGLHPAQQLSYPSATLTGQLSGQVGFADFYPMPGTTLFAGQAISETVDPKGLTAANFGYDMFPTAGTLILQTLEGGPIWQAGYDPKNQRGTRLVMQADGNLVFFSGAGAVLWTSHTGGSGSNNRLILQNDGNAVMFTGAGTPIWSSQAGVIGAPSNLHSYAYASASRPLVLYVARSKATGKPVLPLRASYVPGPALYINALIKQAIWTGSLVRGAHRPVYLQRYLAGHWQNLLSRTTDSAGQFTVGFIQPKPYVYRLVLPRTATATAATSSPFIR